MLDAETTEQIRLASYILFGAIGLGAMAYGKKNALWRPTVIGVALAGYPYFVSQILALYIVGIVLTAALFVWRE